EPTPGAIVIVPFMMGSTRMRTLSSPGDSGRLSPITRDRNAPGAQRRYSVIYADPPWAFQNRSDKGTGRNAISHYDCLDLRDLAGLPVAEFAADDCVLLLWAVDPLLDRAMDLIRAWGFTYKTVGFYWVKRNRETDRDAAGDPGFFTGLGYWTRANPEQCLLATRGKPRRRARDVPRLVVEPRREHSRKPDAIRTRIERLVDGPYLELFARETKPGWGAEVELFDTGPVATRRQPSRISGQTKRR
ncbi:MAG: MT-A70 family methyltransferase, partial [Roseiarcus sp.]